MMSRGIIVRGRLAGTERRRAGIGHLARGSSAVLVATLLSAASGFLFWLMAARRFETDAVGRATALWSSTAFVVYLTNMGLGAAVGRYAADDSTEHSARFAVACAYTILTGAVGSVVYLVAFGVPGTRVSGTAQTWVGRFVFVALVSLISAAAVVDIRLMALRKWRWVTIRSACASVSKLLLAAMITVAISVPRHYEPMALFIAAVAPEAATGLLGVILLGRRGSRSIVRNRQLPHLGTAVRYANVNYLSVLAIQAPMMAIPVVVLSSVSAATNAGFYIAWSIASTALLVPQAIMWALHVEGKKDGELLAKQVKQALRASLALSGVCTVGSVVVARIIPVIYGQSYARAGHVLPWLVATSVPWAVVLVLVTEARVEERSRATLMISVTFAGASLIPAVVLTPVFGIAGAVGSLLVGTTLSAGMACGLRRPGAERARVRTRSPGEVSADFGDVAALSPALAEVSGAADLFR